MLGALIIRQIAKSAMKSSASSKAMAAGAETVADGPRLRKKPNIVKRTAKNLGLAGLVIVSGLALTAAVNVAIDIGYSVKGANMAHLDAAAPVSQSDIRALGDEYASLFKMGGRQFSAGMAAASPFSDLDDLREAPNERNRSFFEAGAAFQRKNGLFKEEIRAISDRLEQGKEEFETFYKANMADGNVALLAGAVIALQGQSEAIDSRIVSAVNEWKSGSQTRSAYAEQMGRFMRTELAVNPVLLMQTAALLDEYRPVLNDAEKRGLSRNLGDMPKEQRERALEIMGSPYISLDMNEIEELIPGRDEMTRALENDAPSL